MKKCSDTIGNRTRDLLACSAVPQPTAPPRTPAIQGTNVNSTRFEVDSPNTGQVQGWNPGEFVEILANYKVRLQGKYQMGAQSL